MPSLDPLIHDSGEVLEGAKKHRMGFLTREQIAEMTPDERDKLVRKDNLWPAPNYEKMVVEGQCTQKGALLIRMLRRGVPTEPTYSATASIEGRKAAAQAYADLVWAMRSITEGARHEDDLTRAISESPTVAEYLMRREGKLMVAGRKFESTINTAFAHERHTISYNMRVTLRSVAEQSLDSRSRTELRNNPAWPVKDLPEDAWLKARRITQLQSADGGWTVGYYGNSTSEDYFAQSVIRQEEAFKEIVGKSFPSQEALRLEMHRIARAALQKRADQARIKRDAFKAKAEGKSASDPGSLVERVGRDWRKGTQANADDILQKFGLRGNQWGNYVTLKSRPEFLNRVYDALHDLAAAMQVPTRAIGMNGRLGIAVGARGSGKNRAHYEPGRDVINLTRDAGAGATAHEFGHAFDHLLGDRATQLGLVASRVDPQSAGYLSNLELRPAGTGQMSNEERLLRDWHKGMQAIWQRSEPFTKAELVDTATRNRAKYFAYMNDIVNTTEARLRARNPDAEAMRKFMDLAGKVRGPQAENAFDDIVSGAAGIAHMKEVQMCGMDRYVRQGLEGLVASIKSLEEKTALPDNHTQQLPRPQPTEYTRACHRLDRGKKEYYAERHEMFARTFEAIIWHELADKQTHNLFLVDGADGEAFPQGKELEMHQKNLLPLIGRFHELVPGIENDEPSYLEQDIPPAPPVAAPAVKKVADMGEQMSLL